MWLSKKLSKSVSADADTNAQLGSLTISSENMVAAGASSEVRNLEFYAPVGYSFSPSEGQNVLLLSCGSKTVCAGVLMQTDPELKSGEIKISSPGGAQVVLKNNGDIILNKYITVDKNGDVEIDGSVTATRFVSKT